MRRVSLISTLVSLALSCALVTVEASQVRSIDLEQMTQRAARIFSGRCVATEVVFDATVGGRVTVATFSVDRGVKGTPERTVTVRMLGASTGDRREGDTAGVPAFRVGEEVVLFLYGESALGLTAPVGLGQGRFEIVTDKQGRKLALNDLANKNLVGAGRAGHTARFAEALDPASLLDRVEQLVSGPR
jgi:hypothetical protein